MSDLRWSEVREVLEDDGSLRDIYVLSATEDDWQRVLDLIRAGGWPYSFTEDQNSTSLPTNIGDIFPPRMHSLLLQIRPIEGVAIHCYFFRPDEIEFDLCPREVVGQTQLDAVCAFLRAIGKTLAKPVLVTWESAPSSPIIRYEPSTDDIVRVFGNPPPWE